MKKKKVEIDAKILSKCACTMYGPVYYTLIQVYQTAIVNPELRKHDHFSEYIFFALPPQPVSQ